MDELQVRTLVREELMRILIGEPTQNQTSKPEWADWPPVLYAKEIAEITGTSLSSAHRLMRRSDFPARPMSGSRLGIGRVAFAEWLNGAKSERSRVGS